MTVRSDLALVSTLALTLLVPLPALATIDDVATPGSAVTFDTPAPEPRAVSEATPEPQRPRPSPVPTQAPGLPDLPQAPDRDALSIGYGGSGIMRQAPLLVAELAGYLDAVGLPRVTISSSPAVLADVLSGDLDIAVVDALEVAAANAEDPSFRAIAGYDNYPGGDYGGSVLVAAPGLVADEPATVIAFLAAYIRALQDLSAPDSAAAALQLIEDTDVAIEPGLADDWPNAVSVFAPFDGGFGAAEDEDGLDELAAYLTSAADVEPDLTSLIAGHTLSIAQSWSGLATNPLHPLAGPPGVTDIVIGLPLGDDAAGPIAWAIEQGYFEDAGFASVEILDVEAPLLGVLQGQLDVGIVDAVDAADGAIQGLPLVVLAGYRNYDIEGVYGGDLVVASADVLAEEGSTISAFLIAYLRALQDLRDDATFAPHDGGFGARDQAGGLAELEDYLQAALGVDAGVDRLVQTGPLEYAQAWLGLPANPTTSEEAE